MGILPSAKTNIRQRELEEQQKNMVSLAVAYVRDYGDYSTAISLNDFMARFRVFYHASEYASKRYFKDFVTLGLFEPNEKETSFTVTTDKKIQAMITRVYGVQFPEPKTASTAQARPQPSSDVVIHGEDVQRRRRKV